MKTLGLIILALLCLTFAYYSTQSPEKNKISKSGDTDIDQSAIFLKSIIKIVQKDFPKFNSLEIIEYITSTAGSASLYPPNPEIEPDAASMYKGPQPSSAVFIQLEGKRNELFPKHLILSAKKDKNSITVKAFKDKKDEEAFFTWDWPIAK